VSDSAVVLVTGASSGIGRATVLRAAADEAHIVLLARSRSKLEQTAADCERAGAASTLVVSADVGDDAQVAKAVETVLRERGRLDVVVSNAGVVSYGRVDQVPTEVFDGIVRTNLLGSANVARHVLPVLRRQGRGTLILVGSVIGHVAVPSLTPYTVSKWGVRALVRQLRLENRDVPGVRIGYVAPGGVDTPIYRLAANYDGFEGRPPPPVASPDRVARQILARVRHPRLPDQLSAVNHLVRLGHAVLPPVYDRIVGPLCYLLTVDLGRPTPAGPGNVLASGEEDEPQRDTAARDPLLVSLGRNVRALMGARE
jgi:NAD(P)-dependent dehydrogenase (short-subunit alcohol dehydrogenase family)